MKTMTLLFSLLLSMSTFAASFSGDWSGTVEYSEGAQRNVQVTLLEKDNLIVGIIKREGWKGDHSDDQIELVGGYIDLKNPNLVILKGFESAAAFARTELTLSASGQEMAGEVLYLRDAFTKINLRKQ